MVMRSLYFLSLVSIAIFLAEGSFGAASAQSSTYQDWYPTSISAPAGHTYPCALTALPKDLTGIPDGDKRFINHVYAMLLKCCQAKLVMIDELMKDNGAYSTTYAKYYADTAAARQKIATEPVPKGLESFRNSVLSAVDQQVQFFNKAVTARQQGQSAQQVLAIPEGRAASSMLFAAWSEMQTRYPSMSAPVKDSTYHHLCALDLF